jgi:hypothetical protein
LGEENDDHINEDGRRVESFEINDAEKLIGCELHHSVADNDEDFERFEGVTWLKMKMIS